MKAKIVYDSAYGNTEKIAQTIGNALGKQDEVVVSRAGAVKADQLAGTKLLIIGSPTQRFNSTLAISELLKGVPKDGLRGVKVAAFDTRLTERKIAETPVLAFFVKMWGRAAYAANTIAKMLTKKGGELVAPPEGFFVEDTEGPLVQGELERAALWGKHLSELNR